MIHLVSLLAKGVVLGFSVAAPVGPIGLICIQRTLTFGRRAGFISGLGAASADLICAGVMSLGLTAVLVMTGEFSWILQAAGGAYLFWLGLCVWRSIQAGEVSQASDASMRKMFGSVFFLTVINPLTWMSYAGAFAGLGGEVASQYYLSGVAFMVGVFAGSAAWWLLLSLVTERLRTRLHSGSLVWINRVSGAVIIGFGIWSLLVLVV
jgi:threonine/homoserine/homoserine lactone efflux protein